MSDDYEPRLYLCEQCGFVLGVVLRKNDRRPKLNVLRNGCHLVQIKALGDLRDVRYVVRDMEQGTISCGMCGAERTWRMSDQAMDDLLARRKKRTFGLEVA